MASEEISSEISKETVPAENTTVESQNNGQEEQEEDLQGSYIKLSPFGPSMLAGWADVVMDGLLWHCFPGQWSKIPSKLGQIPH